MMSPEARGRPQRLVDETGDVAEVQRLLQEVADLGVVVLSGPPLPRDGAIDLYADLHVRGITLITDASQRGPDG